MLEVSMYHRVCVSAQYLLKITFIAKKRIINTLKNGLVKCSFVIFVFRTKLHKYLLLG